VESPNFLIDWFQLAFCQSAKNISAMSEALDNSNPDDPGQPQTPEQFLAVVYNELRRLAEHKLTHEIPGQTLQATALVHDAWLRLTQGGRIRFEGKTHFFNAAAEAMRRILIERARRRKSVRHGGEYVRIELEEDSLVSPESDDLFLILNEALEKFSQEHPRQAAAVKLRYFTGMTHEQIAEALGISPATAKNYWAFSRAWLLREVSSRKQNDR
jgi:RNA polymerase sigma factor (TIGR02999 family)